MSFVVDTWEQIAQRAMSADPEHRRGAVLDAQNEVEDALRGDPSGSGVDSRGRFNFSRAIRVACARATSIRQAEIELAIAHRNACAHTHPRLSRAQAVDTTRTFAEVWCLLTGQRLDIDALFPEAHDKANDRLITWWSEIGDAGMRLAHAAIYTAAMDPTWISGRDVISLLPTIPPEAWLKIAIEHGADAGDGEHALDPVAKALVEGWLLGKGADSRALVARRVYEAGERSGLAVAALGVVLVLTLVAVVWLVGAFLDPSMPRAIAELVVSSTVAAGALLALPRVLGVLRLTTDEARVMALTGTIAAAVALFGAGYSTLRAADAPAVVRALLAVAALAGFGALAGFVAIGTADFAQSQLFRWFRYAASSTPLAFAGAVGWAHLDSSTQFGLQVRSVQVGDRTIAVIDTPRGGFFVAEDVLGTLAPDPGSLNEEPTQVVLPEGSEIAIPGYYLRYDPTDGGETARMRSSPCAFLPTFGPQRVHEFMSLQDPELIARFAQRAPASQAVPAPQSPTSARSSGTAPTPSESRPAPRPSPSTPIPAPPVPVVVPHAVPSSAPVSSAPPPRLPDPVAPFALDDDFEFAPSQEAHEADPVITREAPTAFVGSEPTGVNGVTFDDLDQVGSSAVLCFLVNGKVVPVGAGEFAVQIRISSGAGDGVPKHLYRGCVETMAPRVNVIGLVAGEEVVVETYQPTGYFADGFAVYYRAHSTAVKMLTTRPGLRHIHL